MKDRQRGHTIYAVSRHSGVTQTANRYSSHHYKNNFTTPQKLISKKSSKNLTSDQYLQAKLEFTENKKTSIEKMMESKNIRIRQLQLQLKQSRQLIRQALSKWKLSENQAQSRQSEKIVNISVQNQKLKDHIKMLEQKLNNEQNNRIKIEQQNKEIKNRNTELQKQLKLAKDEHRKDRRQWSITTKYINQLIGFVKSLPEEILDGWNIQNL